MAMARPDTPEPHGDERVPNLDSSAEERDWTNLGETNVLDAAAKSSTPSLGNPIPLDQAGPGMVLGDFRLLEKLGEGAMGAVYRAEQISFDRVVALKLLFSRIAKQPNLVERLYREGRVLGQLDHPNIVQAYAIDELNGSHYVAMEFVEGDNLQRWIRKLSRLAVEDAVLITMKIAEALQYAHGQGVIHRDLKPENILITNKGVVKIADFGMVKVTDEEMDLTQTGHALGTPWYMPLEQAKNAKDIDGRSDIYALGCMFYCMLTGSPPFAGRTFVEVLQAKELGTFPPARSVNQHVPERLDLILMKMCQKQPKHRYATGGEVVRDLESLGLAATRLSFLTATPKTGLGGGTKPALGKTGLGKTLMESGMPSIDPHVWYLRMSGGNGKFSTEQVLAMIESGKVNMTTMASHLLKSDYRALSTYKEFAALLAKSARQADKAPSRYEEIYKEAEKRDKVREETLATHRDRSEWRDVVWYYASYVAAAVAVVLVFFWFMSRFWN
jgi:eukaryotic-like serine/threonine-protein kinase